MQFLIVRYLAWCSFCMAPGLARNSLRTVLNRTDPISAIIYTHSLKPRTWKPERTTAMKKRSVWIASFMTLAMAMPVWSDTLVLRDGRTLSGTLMGANRISISFQDRTGQTYRYS